MAGGRPAETGESSSLRAVVQRVRGACVEVGGRVTGRIGPGLVLLLGIRKGDGDAEIRYLAEKVLDLRIFPDEKHSMNRSIREAGGEMLLVSQFTLYGDARKGRRPSFDEAEEPARARAVYTDFATYLKSRGHEPREGVFGEHMLLTLENDGPVTILLDSERAF
jgi:D-tyrosyl-tRNA(Tyr) deacylase